MYSPIQMSNVEENRKLFNQFSINIGNQAFNESYQLFQEAVFVGGKKSVEPLVPKIQAIKDKLEEELSKQDKSVINVIKKRAKNKDAEEFTFDPEKFFKDLTWKGFEDEVQKIFGFRSVQIFPFIEKYNSFDKTFQSKQMNCIIYHSDRFPIEGLVTDKGFYDKSRSINIEIHITLGLLRALTAEEILSVFLHEFGHSIDPALVDISYIETNILSKYLTDRKNAINKNEKKFIEKMGQKIVPEIVVVSIILLISFIPNIIDSLKRLFMGKEKYQEKQINKLRKIINADKDMFNRQNYSEAFADNFTRMYGYATQLVSAFKKMSKDLDNYITSRYKREKVRQKYILMMTENALKDVHRTDIHRIRSLIKEYKDDIKDPNINKIVKKQLEEDVKELELVLDEYCNNFDDFHNRINKTINEELEKMESRSTSSNKKDKELKEGFVFFDESAKAYKELMKAKEYLTTAERSKVKELFGQSNKCSFSKDKDGYYCYTHRCRSKSYPEIEKIPMKDVEFVRSTC